MNREIVGGGGAAVYPLVGDVKSTAGQGPVTVVGIQNIPVIPSFPTGGEVLTYDGPSNTLSLEAPVQQIELETNGTPNSTQALLNLAAGANVTLTEVSGTVTIASTGGGGGVTRGALNSNANGEWWVWSDGVIESWGSISIAPTTTQTAVGTITFPLPYTTAVTGIEVCVVGLPRLASSDGASVLVASLSTAAAGVSLQCNVPTGGGGATFDQAVQVFWRAIGT